VSLIVKLVRFTCVLADVRYSLLLVFWTGSLSNFDQLFNPLCKLTLCFRWRQNYTLLPVNSADVMWTMWIFCRDVPDLTVSNLAGFRNSNPAGSRFGWNFFGSQNNTHNETNSINNAVSCCKEAVQFSASFVTSQFASFWRNLWSGNEFCIFVIHVKLIKIANTPLDTSAALVLSP